MHEAAMDHTPTYGATRREFLRASVFAGGLLAWGGTALAAAAQEGDLGVLNYALSLEHFESRLHRDLIDSGLLSGDVLAYVQAYAEQEAAHVELLTSAIQELGGEPVVAQESYNWPKLDSQEQVVGILATVQDVAAAAYLGAAPLIQSPELLTVAVRIHNVEAYHATTWRILDGQSIVPSAFAEGMTEEQVLKTITPFLQAMPNTGAGGASPAQEGAALPLAVVGLGAAALGLGLRRRQEQDR